MSTFSIKFEGSQCELPKEFEKEGELNWDNKTFFSADEFAFLCEDGRWTEINFDSYNQMYSEYQRLNDEGDTENVELRRLNDFTGEISFVSFTPQKDSDYDLIAEFSAVVIYGKLDKVELIQAKKVDNSKRKRYNAELLRQIETDAEVINKWWFKPYSVYSLFLRGISMAVIFIWQVPAVILNWLVKKLTPEIK
jgi:hypothetical protein|tara:strand:- start:819 stop:1400 length:582 start_codon:yes stop_codon:yes gene_type:complete